MIIRAIFVITITIPIILSAQTGQIKYRVKVPNSSIDEMHNEPGYLYFDMNQSLFFYDRKQDRELGSQSRYRDEYGQIVYCDKTTNTCFFRVFFWMSPYISHEPIPVIKWQLHPDKKMIMDKLCKKATTTFRGRKYVVWYTSSIPVFVGPWKLQGLPGAILEAKSEDGEVAFETEFISFPADVSEHLNKDIKEKFSVKESLPGKYVSFEEFKSAREKEAEKVHNTFQNNILPMIEQLSVEKNMPLSTKDWKVIPNKKMFSIEISFE